MRTYLRLLRYAAPYKLRIAAAILCMVVLSLSTAAYANLLGPALEFLFTGRGEVARVAAGASSRRASISTRFLAGLDRRQVLAALPLVIIAVSLLKGFAAFGQQYLMGMVGQRMVGDLRRATFDHLLRLSPGLLRDPQHRRHPVAGLGRRVGGRRRRRDARSRATSATGSRSSSCS